MKIDSTTPVFDVSAIAPRRQPDPQEHRDLIQAVRSINAAELFGEGNELTFSLDQDTHRPVMRIVNRDTNEVINQIPSEQVLRIAEHLRLLEKHRLLRK